MIRTLILISLSILFVNMLFSAEKTWNGINGSNYSHDLNWTPGGVPAVGDMIIIPSGSPTCNFDVTEVELKKIDNQGTITLNGNVILTNEFLNSGTLNVEGEGAKILKRRSLGVEFNNSGTVNSSEAQLDILIGSYGTSQYEKSKFVNTGDITAMKLIVKAREIRNDNLIIGTDLYFDDYDFLTNNYEILGTDSETENGGKLFFRGKKIENNGRIQGGYGGNNKDGGRIDIYGWDTFMHKGILQGGDGGVAGKGGEIYIEGFRVVTISGLYKTGYSNWGNEPPVPTYIIADSIDVFPGDSTILVGLLYLRAHKVTFADIFMNNNILGYNGVEIYTSATGIVDFHQANLSESIVSIKGEIRIYSNLVVEPHAGVNVVCYPDPIINDYDSSIKGAAIFTPSKYVQTVRRDSLPIVLKNTSTNTRDVEYSISSTKGWVDASGSYPMEYFSKKEFMLDISIPKFTETGECDTIIAISSVDGTAYDTAYGLIYCFGIKTPERVSLISPLSNSTDLKLDLSIEWTCPEYDYFYLQAARDADFTDLIVDESDYMQSSYSFTDELEYLSKYYWRVKSHLYGIDGEWSFVWNFTTKQIDPPSMPELVAPENETYELPKKSVLQWTESQRADSYEVQLSKNAEFTDLALDSNSLTSTSCDIASYLEPEEYYHWRVRARNAGGASSWTEAWWFQTDDFTTVDEIISDGNISIFPVPFDEEINIRIYSTGGEPYQLKLYDYQGRELISYTTGKLLPGEKLFTLSTGNVPLGAAFIKLSSGNFERVIPVIKIR